MAASNTTFNQYSKYYDCLYHDKDYVKEVDYISNILVRHLYSNCEILEFGSGTGRHGRLLAEQGFKVIGIEQSAEMVARSPVVDGFQCYVGDICTYSLPKKFDAVLALFHVISYLVQNDNLLSVFKNASQHLRINGIFIFDFWYSPAVYSQRPSVRVKRFSNESTEVIRIAEPKEYTEENRVDVNYMIIGRDVETNNVEIIQEIHSMRHFSLPEIDLLASITGFERVCAEEFLTASAVNEQTWGACVILKKVS